MKTEDKRWRIPWIFAGFMGIVLAANAALTFFAIDSWPGMETKKPYEKGLAYNQALAGAKAQAKLRWDVDFTFTPAKEEPKRSAARRGELSAVFHGPDGKPLKGMTVKAVLIRPVREGVDAAFDLADKGDGSYAAVVDFPLPGRWAVRIHAFLGEDSYQMKREIMVP